MKRKTINGTKRYTLLRRSGLCLLHVDDSDERAIRDRTNSRLSKRYNLIFTHDSSTFVTGVRSFDFCTVVESKNFLVPVWYCSWDFRGTIRGPRLACPAYSRRPYWLFRDGPIPHRAMNLYFTPLRPRPDKSSRCLLRLTGNIAMSLARSVFRGFFYFRLFIDQLFQPSIYDRSYVFFPPTHNTKAKR